MRAKALATLAALLALAISPAVAQEGQLPPPTEPAETTAVPAEEGQAVQTEPVAPEAVELGAAEQESTAQSEFASEPATTESDPAAALPQEEQGTVHEEMPRTASPLALLALLGLGSAGSALGLRFVRRK